MDPQITRLTAGFQTRTLVVAFSSATLGRRLLRLALAGPLELRFDLLIVGFSLLEFFK